MEYWGSHHSIWVFKRNTNILATEVTEKKREFLFYISVFSVAKKLCFIFDYPYTIPLPHFNRMANDRKNINRGFKKLRVWQDAVSLYVLACKIFVHFPYELKRIAGNTIDSYSISRNIAEGYCRKSLKEYLNYLNISLGSCGEFYSAYYSCYQANQITENEFEELDELHYKVENQLLKLVESLQKKLKEGKWEDTFDKD